MNGLIFAAGALSENFRATMAGPVEGQPAALDQHPAADDVIDHQQQEPDGDRGFQTRKQRLGGGEVADGGRQHGHQRGAKHQVPQQAVHHIVAIPLFIQIERNTGVLKAQGDHRQRAADQQEAQAAQRSGEFAVVKIIEHDQRHNQRHNQPDAHQVVAHRLRHAATRPAEVGDKQPVWPGEGGADHHHPQQRHRRGDSIANRHRQRERPGGLQTIAERHPQHRQRRGHQYRPEDRAQRQPEVILGDFPHPGAGALKEAGEMAPRADAKANQQQGGKQRQQGLFAGKHHRAGFTQFADGIQGDQAPQILDDLQRPGEADGADVRSPEQIAVGGFVDLFQRVFQLAVGDLQLGELQHQGIAAAQQRVQQLVLRAQLRLQDLVLLAGQRLAVGLTDLPQLRLLTE